MYMSQGQGHHQSTKKRDHNYQSEHYPYLTKFLAMSGHRGLDPRCGVSIGQL
jgi:hypothetical protein